MFSTLSFLTRIPIKSNNVNQAARTAYLFPVIGFLIGVIVYLIGVVTFKCLLPEIAAMITVLSIYGVIGLIHLDGLADFSDGVITSGTQEKKIAAMKDIKVGIAGVFSVLVVLILTFYALKQLGADNTSKIIFFSHIPMYKFGCAIIISEISAKLSMNTCIVLGKKKNFGIGGIFIERSTKTGYIIAVLLAIFLSFILANIYFPMVFIGIFVALGVIWVAHKNFGGLIGDAFGAANELTRVISLIAWTVIL
jgi:adenosylcobinamide-GDP ribazoletransferase